MFRSQVYNKELGPQSKGRVGRKSVTIMFGPQFPFTMELPPYCNNVLITYFHFMTMVRIFIAFSTSFFSSAGRNILSTSNVRVLCAI